MPCRFGKIGLDDREEPADDVFVVVAVPLAREVVVRVGQAFEEAFGGVEAWVDEKAGKPPALAAVVANFVDRHPPQPNAKRPFALTIKPRNFAKEDDEYVLSKIRRLVAEPRNPSQPDLDHRQIDRLKALPFGGVGPRGFKPIEQAEGCRCHGKNQIRWLKAEGEDRQTKRDSHLCEYAMEVGPR